MDYDHSSFMYFIDRLVPLLSIYVCSAIVFFRLKSIKINSRKIVILIVCGVTIILICQLLGGITNVGIKLLFFALICIVLITLCREKYYAAVCSAIVTIAIVLCIQYIGVFISGLFLYIAGAVKIKIIATIIGSLVPIILCIILSSLRSMKKRFLYFEDETHAGIGLLLSSYILVLSLLLTQQINFEAKWGMVFVAVSPLILVGLFLWIRSIFNGYIKRKIDARADAFTQQELKEKDEKIERLETEVATLAKQLHRDNHLLSSLDRSAQMLVTTDSAQEREKLVDEIHTLYRERNDMITKDQQANKLLPSTGISLIDGALSDMYVKATAHGINFDLIVSEQIHYLVNNIISQTDLQTLLCDHIKDAIIAIDTADITNGKILVNIEKNEGIFEISIRDNGVDFEPDTLAKLGIERVTTHADDGGSGIGFMTTFETLAKAKGSLIITEYKNKTPFSKAVTFSFDGLHRFIISSYRKEELKEKSSRDDIIYL